jgi:hypothetical protein
MRRADGEDCATPGAILRRCASGARGPLKSLERSGCAVFAIELRGRAPIVVMMRMPASEVSTSALVAIPGHVPMGALELARVPLRLVLASCDGFWAWAVMLVARGIALRRAQSGDQREDEREGEFGRLEHAEWRSSRRDFEPSVSDERVIGRDRPVTSALRRPPAPFVRGTFLG